MEIRLRERATPLAAAATALAAFACCVPLGLAGAAGVVALGSFFDLLQSWFMPAAVLLLALGAVQSYRIRKSCRRAPTRFSVTVLGLSATIVLAVLLFPQRVAGAIADYVLSSAAGPSGERQPTLAAFDGLTSLKAEFNRDAASLRVILLLSPSCPYCLKGASEVERILEKHQSRPIVVFVVWQPILPTDWGLPGVSALGRLFDPRVRQFWDGDHRVAAALQQTFQRRDPQPGCCVHQGVWWDLMAVFPAGAEWRDTLPEPMLLDGTVEDAAPAFDQLLTDAK